TAPCVRKWKASSSPLPNTCPTSLHPWCGKLLPWAGMSATLCRPWWRRHCGRSSPHPERCGASVINFRQLSISGNSLLVSGVGATQAAHEGVLRRAHDQGIGRILDVATRRRKGQADEPDGRADHHEAEHGRTHEQQ